jgi:hypothetical protein
MAPIMLSRSSGWNGLVKFSDPVLIPGSFCDYIPLPATVREQFKTLRAAGERFHRRNLA